jgi:ribose transport system substrate-binding protein
MTMRQRVTAAASLVAAGALLAACGGSTPASSTSESAAPATSTAAKDLVRSAADGKALDCQTQLTSEDTIGYQVPKAKEKFRVTLMEVSLAAYYYQGIKKGAEDAAKAAGVDLEVLAGQGYASPQMQLEQAQAALQRGTDAIILAPSDINGSAPIVKLAQEKGVPVVNVSTFVAAPGAYHVLQDDAALGAAAADRVAEALGAAGGEGLIIAGPANADWSKARTEAFKARVAEKHPQLKVAAAPTQLVDPVAGLKSFEDAVQAHPNIKWIFNVHVAILPPASIPSPYKGSVTYVATGYEPDAVPALKDGSLDSTFGIEPIATGKVGVGTAVNILNGTEQPHSQCLPVPLFTKDDVGNPAANSQLIPAS